MTEKNTDSLDSNKYIHEEKDLENESDLVLSLMYQVSNDQGKQVIAKIMNTRYPNGVKK